MPEAAIGFVSDVGVNAILARAPLAPGAALSDERQCRGGGGCAGARAHRLRREAVAPAGPAGRDQGGAAMRRDVETADRRADAVRDDRAGGGKALRRRRPAGRGAGARHGGGDRRRHRGARGRNARSMARSFAAARRPALRRSSSAIMRRGTGRTSMPCSRSTAGSRGSWRVSPTSPKGCGRCWSTRTTRRNGRRPDFAGGAAEMRCARSPPIKV